MSALQVIQGDLVRVTCAFADVDGVATAPTVVTLQIQAADGTMSEPTPHAGVGTGTFYADVDIPYLPESAGRWVWRWQGTGAVQAASEGYWTVLASELR